MELGEKILQARLEAGLSQRQLCGEEITRNMLSQIEHGTARPSMKTLGYLAQRLGRPISYFLDENTVTSPNLQRMQDARRAYADGANKAAWEILGCCELPDPVLEGEYWLLTNLVLLELAEAAIREGKRPYAKKLLEQAEIAESKLPYWIPDLRRRRLLLAGRILPEELETICASLSDLDEELLLRAEAALSQKNPKRAAEWLRAAEKRETPRWNLLMGKACFQLRQYAQAVECLKKGEGAYPRECWPLLESCFRELGDFQQAYYYACKQR